MIATENWASVSPVSSRRRSPAVRSIETVVRTKARQFRLHVIVASKRRFSALVEGIGVLMCSVTMIANAASQIGDAAPTDGNPGRAGEMTSLIAQAERVANSDALGRRPDPSASSKVVAVSPPAFSTNGFLVPASFLGLHIHRPRTVPWPAVQFGVWRWWDTEGLGWSGIEPARGQWDFAAPDFYVGLAETAKVDVIWTLGGLTPRWASARPGEKCHYGDGCAAEPVSTDDWADYVKAVATRYKGRIRYYEIWNEPHLAATFRSDRDFYSGSAQTLVEMTRIAYQTIKSVDPDARILSPAPVAEPARIEPFFRLGGGAYIDIVAAHFYTYPVENLPSLVAPMRAMLRKYGQQDKELWNTEAGFLIGGTTSTFIAKPGGTFGNRLSDEEAAATIARYQLVAASLQLSRSVLYAWDNDAMGLTAGRGQRPTEVTRSLKRVTSWLVNARVFGCGSTNRSLWVCSLERAGRKAWAAWNVEGPISWQLPSNWNATAAERLSGSDEIVPPSGAITVDYFPVLIKVGTAPWGV